MSIKKYVVFVEQVGDIWPYATQVTDEEGNILFPEGKTDADVKAVSKNLESFNYDNMFKEEYPIVDESNPLLTEEESQTGRKKPYLQPQPKIEGAVNGVNPMFENNPLSNIEEKSTQSIKSKMLPYMNSFRKDTAASLAKRREKNPTDTTIKRTTFGGRKVTRKNKKKTKTMRRNSYRPILENSTILFTH
jgi:hypothetical protein